jgi:c-di-GMP-related signal transduction protein
MNLNIHVNEINRLRSEIKQLDDFLVQCIKMTKNDEILNYEDEMGKEPSEKIEIMTQAIQYTSVYLQQYLNKYIYLMTIATQDIEEGREFNEEG